MVEGKEKWGVTEKDGEWRKKQEGKEGSGGRGGVGREKICSLLKVCVPF